MSIGRRGVWFGVGALALVAVAVVWALNRGPSAETWQPEAEGFLAVATPCCEEASLWRDLDSETDDGQRARPATAADAAAWLNTWPYRDRGEEDTQADAPLQVAVRSNEVRCVGPPSGAEVPRDGDDVATVEALRDRTECSYARWQVWADETAAERPNERHTVWADEDGAFHGRVDYWGTD